MLTKIMKNEVYAMCLYTLFALALITLTLNVGGCGGESGSTAASQATAQVSTVQGIAAAGNPISGTVYLSDSSTPVNEISAKITEAGEFSLNTAGLKAPFILKSEDGSKNNMFSYATAPGNVNINPLSTLAVAVAAGAIDSNSLTSLYDGYKQGTSSAVTQLLDIPKVINNVTSNIAISLQALLKPYGAESSDLLTGSYTVDHQGLDGLFDKVSITISNGMVIIMRKDTNTTVFSAQLKDLITSAKPENVITSNIPTPAQYDMPGNAILTLKVQGALPQGTLIKHASFSIQLPAGITVVTTPYLSPDIVSAPALINTAIPVGTAAGSTIYPEPTLFSTNNILTVTVSSVAGFSPGDFLTIRYTDSSSYYMHKRNAEDFGISGATLFSDIYKNQALQDLTIVPVSITFP